jgi:hypothetical protein
MSNPIPSANVRTAIRAEFFIASYSFPDIPLGAMGFSRSQPCAFMLRLARVGFPFVTYPERYSKGAQHHGESANELEGCYVLSDQFNQKIPAEEGAA